eukprot:m.218702 g.218702  ORF g.218702 m.218702 type:complete len:338 (-) comp16994_c3_seq6:80-1093(-)
MDPLPSEEIQAFDAFVEREISSSCLCCRQELQMKVARSISAAVRAFMWAADNLMYLSGWVLVPMAWILISTIVYGWYQVLAPYIMQEKSAALFWVHAVFAHWLLINIVYNYFMVTVTNPGHPPQMPLNDMGVNRQEGESFCKKCQSVKPARAHHCRVCGRCVLKMDHHCPWVHNCIGFRNHRYFFLFMAFLWVGCVYVAWVCSELFFLRYNYSHKPHSLSLEDKIRAHRLLQQGYLGSIMTFSFIMTVAVSIALGGLLAWHIYLVSAGMTTIEFYAFLRPKDSHEQVQRPTQSISTRWKEFLGLKGKRTMLGVLFPSIFHPVGDGMKWRSTKPRTWV